MSNIPDCTLTTGCYLLTKYNSHSRSIEQTLTCIDPLLSIPCYLVIYCNKDLESYIQNIRFNKYNLGHLTKIIVKEIEELWCYPLIEKIRQNRESYWPTRDTRISPESTSLVFNKFNFVLQTIEDNPFQTSKFGWIDANIQPNGSKICEEDFYKNLLFTLHHTTHKFHLQILNIEDKKYRQIEHKKEYYQQARWVAAGCLFTTNASRGLKILKRLQDICKETVNAGFGHGEEYFYLEILDEFYDDIQKSYGDYRQTLHNFILPTKNFVYIYWNIIMRNYNFAYYRDAIDAINSLLYSFDNFHVEINYDLYVRLYAVLYLSYLRLNDTIMSTIISSKINYYYKMNPYFRNHFIQLKNIINLDDYIIS
jgi:hypothetical protein